LSSELEKVEKALGEPFATDFSDYVRKIRNGLIIISFISISLLLGEVQIDSDKSSFLGLKFDGLNNDLVIWVIFFLNAYMYVHFLWCSLDNFQEWSLRVTGTRLVHITTARLSSTSGDYPNDPRQSTLYNWWKEEAQKISSLQEPIERIQADLKACEEQVKIALEGRDPNVVNICMSINQVSENINRLNSSVEKVSIVIKSERIPVSLKRFDARFKLFLRSQNFRWLVIELLFPLLLGAYALVLLAIKLSIAST